MFTHAFFLNLCGFARLSIEYAELLLEYKHEELPRLEESAGFKATLQITSASIRGPASQAGRDLR